MLIIKCMDLLISSILNNNNNNNNNNRSNNDNNTGFKKYTISDNFERNFSSEREFQHGSLVFSMVRFHLAIQPNIVGQVRFFLFYPPQHPDC